MGFKKILVAFDGSADSIKAVKAASTLARCLGSELTLLHVYSVPVYTYGGPGGLPQDSIESLTSGAKERGESALQKGLKIARDEQVEASGETVESGSVVEAIVEYAARKKTHLIVIGTRGMTGFKKLLLGSVSNGVVAHAPCPVLVVR